EPGPRSFLGCCSAAAPHSTRLSQPAERGPWRTCGRLTVLLRVGLVGLPSMQYRGTPFQQCLHRLQVLPDFLDYLVAHCISSGRTQLPALPEVIKLKPGPFNGV